MTELPSVSDWREADVPAQELTDRIMRGMDCVNPSVFERHVKAVLTAYIAQEAAERRAYASRAFSSPRRADEADRDPGPTDDEILGWNEANEYHNERPDDEG